MRAFSWSLGLTECELRKNFTTYLRSNLIYLLGLFTRLSLLLQKYYQNHTLESHPYLIVPVRKKGIKMENRENADGKNQLDAGSFQLGAVLFVNRSRVFQIWRRVMPILD